MFERFSTSLALARSSWQVLRADKHLIVFPVVSGLACLLVLATFALPFVLHPQWLDFNQGQNGAQVPPWVYVVACNEARRSWRHEQRAPKWSGSERPVVEDAAGRVATVLDLDAALNQLGERQRAAVVLRYFADLPLAEIAAVMGCATGTVKATLHQALDRLRIELEVGDHAD